MDSMHEPGFYSGKAVALLTQHGKERMIAPILDAALGCRVMRVDGYDTDQLGTFTREIPRAGTQLDAARSKARMGMALAGLPLGLASEGAFGTDPMIGMFPWNVEVLIWIDDVQELEVVGVAQGKANFAHLLTRDWTEAAAFARQWEFPGHELVARPHQADDLSCMRKGIASWRDLEAGFAWALQASATGTALLETDVRAHANPTRQANIRRAAENLANKLRSLCPDCGAPGFWCIEQVPGRPCKACGAPTSEPLADVLACVKCTHRATREHGDGTSADPACCDYCNP